MKILASLLWSALLLTACSNGKNEQAAAESDLDAARNFIDAALKGDWKVAHRYMLADSVNNQLIDLNETNYRTHMSAGDKSGYRDATINFYDSRVANDSTTIVNYANSYKKQKDSLKVVRINGQWLVDLKYSFPQTDTTNYVR